MNKTFSVNISGLIFNIEEEAYQVLSLYLETLKTYLRNSQGKEEILADIEARIAELFTQKITDRKQAIVKTEVEDVIAILGQPEEFMLDEEDLTPEAGAETGTEDMKDEKLSKRVYRNADDKIAGGVLSGLAAYFNHDPIWWRLIYVIVVVAGWGSPILIYLILWIIIPEAKTRAEKLQMRGEAVTVESLKRSVEEETEHLRKKAANLADAGAGAKLKGAVQEIVQFFVTALGMVFKVLGKIIAVFLVFWGVIATFASIFMLCAGVHQLTFDNEGLITPHQSLDDLAQFVTNSEGDADLIIIGGFLAMLTTALGALFIGLRMLSSQVRNLGRYNVGLILLALWICGLAMLAIGGGRTLKDFSKTEQTVSTETIPYKGDTLSLVLDEDHHPFLSRFADHGRVHASTDILEIKDGWVYCSDVRLDIQQIDSGRPAEVKVVRYADGRTSLDALKRSQNINYQWKCDSLGNLKFKEYVLFPVKDKYRSQQVNITVYLPVGKSIYLSPRTNRIYFDLRNVTHTWDNDMMGHTWTMTKEGLKCPDFKKEEDRWDP